MNAIIQPMALALVSLLLIFSGLLKLSTLVFSEFWFSFSDLPPWFMAAVAQIEIWVALSALYQLFAGKSGILLARRILLVAYAVIVLFSIAFTFTGQRCGCFGALELPEHFSLAASAFSFSLLILLRLAFPANASSEVNQPAAYQLWPSMLGILIVISGLSVVIGTGVFRNVPQNSGQEVVKITGDFEVAGQVSTVQRIPFQFTNLADVDITVSDWAVSCDCLRLEGIPQTVPAGRTAELAIKFSHRATPDRGKQHFVLFLDHADVPRVAGTVVSRTFP